MRLMLKKIQKTIAIMVVCILFVSLVGCGDSKDNKETGTKATETGKKEDVKETEQSEVKLSENDIELAKKDVFELELLNGEALKWESDDENIATVDESGIVTAVNDGTCVITCTDKEKNTYKCNVTVKTKELNAAELTMAPKQEFTLSVSNSDEQINWSSMDEKIATVSEMGVVTAVAEGSTSIVAETDNNCFECLVTVKAGVESVETVAPAESKNENASTAGNNTTYVPTSTKLQGNSSNSGTTAANKSTTGNASTGGTSGGSSSTGNTSTGNTSGENSSGASTSGGNTSTGSTSGGSTSEETTTKECDHNWQAATCTTPKTCTKCGKTEGFALGHLWKEATCTKAKTCTRCWATEGVALGHNFQWVTAIEAAVGVEGTKLHKCTSCGYADDYETIPALVDMGQETPWEYTDSTYRTKTMYDGTVIYEELVTCGNYTVWGYFDDGAASAMNDAVNYMLSQIDGWNPFNVSSSYYDNARRNAVAYAIKGGSSKAYHFNRGGLPDINNDKQYITLGSDGNNQDNYIGCFVYDTYQGNGDSTYGEYWCSHFGTYYASGSF